MERRTVIAPCVLPYKLGWLLLLTALADDELVHRKMHGLSISHVSGFSDYAHQVYKALNIYPRISKVRKKGKPVSPEA
jgi:hypothetical protein